MIKRFFVWCGNVLLASMLVFLVSSHSAWSQTGTDPDTEGEQTSEQTDNSAQGENPVSSSGQIIVPLTGTATASSSGSLKIGPSQVVFDLLEVGLQETKTFTITHEGGVEAQPVYILDAELFGKSANEFASSFDGFVNLGPGESTEYTVTFSPLTPGDKAAGLRLNIAEATTPYVVLFTGSARYPLTSDLGSSAGKVDFGQATEGSNSQKNFILTNKGEPGAPVINVSAIQISGTNPEAYSLDFSPTVLQPGEQLDVKATMSTGSLGFKSATLEVFHDGNNGSLEIDLEGMVVTPQSVPVNFTSSTLNTSQQITRGTSLQFGPDGKLYVAEMDGIIHVFNITRNGKNNYSGTVSESIGLIKNVPNHNDDGTPNYSGKRLLTGIHVVGPANDPVIYAASSDPRQAAGPSGTDSNLDTNSGILHKLYKSGGNWVIQDLVRGLPRSEENHVSNGLVKVGNKIFLNVGGHTNEGVPSNNFAELPEYALSAATLVIDLNQISNPPYDLPTLNGPADQYDPFGGHDGLNQAILEQNGPVQIFATGLRNAYDIVYSTNGLFYVWDNGSNSGWGGPPGPSCLNSINNGGSNYQDGLHLISQGYYAGHPNPTRGNKANTFGGQSPIEGNANPEECNFKIPGQGDGALTTNLPSTNGLDEYTASNFAGSMQGDLIAAAFNKTIWRVELSPDGKTVTSKSLLKSNQGSVPLDITSQGDDDVFPGTIWIVDNIDKTITVMEPSDY